MQPIPQKLPVLKILVGAFLIPWWNRGTFFRSLGWPILALTGLAGYWNYIAEYRDWYVDWVLIALQGVLLTVFAVVCHRLVIFGTNFKKEPWDRYWTKREFRFLSWFVIVYLLYSLILVIAITVLGNTFDLSDQEKAKDLFPYIKYFSMIPATYVFARCSLVFPATAIDRRVGLKWSWHLSKGNGLRLMIIVGALPWALKTAAWIFLRDNASYFELVAFAFASYILVTFEIAGLSLAFKELSKFGDVNELKANPSDQTEDDLSS